MEFKNKLFGPFSFLCDNLIQAPKKGKKEKEKERKQHHRDKSYIRKSDHVRIIQ